ncbi:MAG: ABC transporter ATP-binding protein/permease [Anaerotignum sp.]|nr:ABC transporter ATP-binding protein/permease [Anaerotignum sp.]
MMFNKRLLAMVPEAKKYILMKVLASWISLVAGIFMWFTVAGIFQKIYDKETLTSIPFVGAMICIIVRFVLTGVTSFLTHKATSCVKSTLRNKIYAKLVRIGSGYSDRFPTAEVVQLAGEGVEQLESYFGNYLPQFFYAILAPFTLFFVFLHFSPLTGIVLFFCVPLIPIVIIKIQKFAKKMLSKYWDAYTNLGDSFLENLQGLTTLKAYGADEKRHEEMNAESEHFRVVTMKVLTMQLNSVTIMDFIAYGGSALGCILVVRDFSLGNVNIGQALAMILLAGEFFLAMRTLGSYFHTAMNGMAASDRMFRLLDLPESPKGKEKVCPGDINVNNLTFSYDGKKKVLTDISLIIPAGSLFAVVGPSGCGKSTLAALISGEKKGYSGSIKIGETEISDAEEESLQNFITVVSANSYLFAGSIRDTLKEGNENASDCDMEEALKKVHLWDFVKAQGGLDMPVSERAANLSGGQRQRLALARAVLKNSPMYIFDEATSNIDAESESAIIEAIYSMRGKHTILLISHRLANVEHSDAIAYFEEGRLAETGTHKEMINMDGRYRKLFLAQRELELIREGAKA